MYIIVVVRANYIASAESRHALDSVCQHIIIIIITFRLRVFMYHVELTVTTTAV